MNECVIMGAIFGYGIDHIAPWVNSLEASGCDEHRVMFVNGVTFETAQFLIQKGFEVIQSPILTSENCVVERFLLYHEYLNLNPHFRNVIATDVRDVVFQTDPYQRLLKCAMLFEDEILGASESIAYRNEDWGSANFRQSFGNLVYHQVYDKTIINAGVMAGTTRAMRDLFLNIYLLCQHLPRQIPGGGGPDQAAYNLLFRTTAQPYSYDVFEDMAWAAQLGTTGPQIADRYGKFLTEPAPTLKEGKVVNSWGVPFAIVHQYDRVPQWRDQILENFT